MTCFWDGILTALGPAINSKQTHQQFIQTLKDQNVKTTDVRWNDKPLTEKEMDENCEAVNCFNISTINSGYYCSCCDPFLLLICQIFKINIDHKYNNSSIKYTYAGTNGPNNTLKFASDRGHFWYTR